MLKFVTARVRKVWAYSYERKIMIGSLCCSTLHFLLVGFIGGDGTPLFGLVVLSGFGAFCLPVLRGVVLRTQKPGDTGAVNALFSVVGVLSKIAGNVIFPQVLKGSQEGGGIGGALGDGAVNFVASALMAVAVATTVWATGRFNPADTGDVSGSGDEENEDHGDLALDVRENELVGLGGRGVELKSENAVI